MNNTNEENYEVMFKVVLIGDMKVGKTNIVSRYIKNEFNKYSMSTIGVEFGSKELVIEGHNVKVQIWDTAGQEKYKSITNAYYKGAKGAFVVYDITNKNSFDNADNWLNNLRASADKKCSIILIGNKSDLENKREVSIEQGEEKAKNSEIAFMETSALSGDNIDKAFEMMINEAYKICHSEMLANVNIDIGKSDELSLKRPKEETPDNKKCC
jgi:small GTP-binding protein